MYRATMFLHKEGLSFNRNWTGDLSSSPMRSFIVVPDEPRDQLAIELIGGDKQLLMVIDEFLLNGAVKAFHVGVHLGSSGIGMPVVFVQAS